VSGLRPFANGKELPPVAIRRGELRPVFDDDGVLVGMEPVKRCPECGRLIGDGENACPPGAQVFPILKTRKETK
jgi:hypothetical protein